MSFKVTIFTRHLFFFFNAICTYPFNPCIHYFLKKPSAIPFNPPVIILGYLRHFLTGGQQDITSHTTHSSFNCSSLKPTTYWKKKKKNGWIVQTRHCPYIETENSHSENFVIALCIDITYFLVT